MRFLFARIADREPIGEDRPAHEVALWLDATLASVSQPRKAELLHVSPRTYQRWISDQEAVRPSGEDERRLRIVARIVNQLRHSLTGPGVVDWFEHPRADLGGATPVRCPRRPRQARAAHYRRRGLARQHRGLAVPGMEVVAFRLANYETPLWSVENFSAGRYNAAGSGSTQYLSLHPLTPWAELLRNEDRRTRDRAVLLRYPLWAIRAQLADEPFAPHLRQRRRFRTQPGRSR